MPTSCGARSATLAPFRHPRPAQPQARHLLRQGTLSRPSPHRERFCRLKDFRRVHTRYDKLAANFLSGVALATAIAFWL